MSDLIRQEAARRGLVEQPANAELTNLQRQLRELQDRVSKALENQ